ncbi:713_t:CDS:2, partial [Acaulospora morrowiae]
DRGLMGFLILLPCMKSLRKLGKKKKPKKDAQLYICIQRKYTDVSEHHEVLHTR